MSTVANWFFGAHAPAPIDYDALLKYPRLMCSIASLVVKRTYPIREVAKIYSDCGVTGTTVNLTSAEWPSLKPVHVRPFLPVPEGEPWDLYAWNAEHFDRIDECREEMNSRGIVVQWCFYELYSWSRRKAGPETPDAKVGPWKQNVNGVDWVDNYEKEHDSDMLAHVLPDPWSRAYLDRAVPRLDLSHNLFLVGNEFPEKSLHERTRDVVRAIQSDAKVSVNRNEDTPGQYTNMKIHREFDYINFHGRLLKRPSDLDRKIAGNSNFPTFRHVLKRPFVSMTDKNSVIQNRIIFSSDGARTDNALGSKDDPTNPYDWANLEAFAEEVFSYGASFEHQSRAKLTDWPNLHMIETDFLTKLATFPKGT